MASQNPNLRTPTTYPHVIVQNPDSSSKSSPIFGNHKSFSHSSLYPIIDKQDLFPNKDDNPCSPSAHPIYLEEIILTVPGAILHLVKDEAAMKLDTLHYFFIICALKESESNSSDDDQPEKGTKTKYGYAKDSDLLLNYGLTIASKGQEKLLKELDGILEIYSGFSVQKVEGKGKG